MAQQITLAIKKKRPTPRQKSCQSCQITRTRVYGKDLSIAEGSFCWLGICEDYKVSGV